MILNRLRRRVASDERGMTLPELLIGTMAATLVIMGGYSMWDASTKMQTRISDRIDSVGRGRIGMERITRDIRSQQCLDSATPAMQWAADLGMQFYASVAAERTGSQPVERRRLEWVQKQNPWKDGTIVGDIKETVWRSNETTPPYSFPAVGRTSILAEDVESDPATPMFRYYGYETGKVGRPSAAPYPLVGMAMNSINTLGRGVATANLQRIVLIEIRYVSRSRHTKISYTMAPPVIFANRVSVRTADPSDPMRSPLCL